MTRPVPSPATASPAREPSESPSAAASHPGPPKLFDGRAEELLTQIRHLPHDDARRERLREELVRMHLPFARNVARRYRNRGDATEDLEQAAMLGLVKAINGFDPDIA
ncbi:sigma factor, partial [Spirillospora sp. NPDC047279]|uniref:sigma factor n=1 Tax=Spirillospora sp. NPDC047279 TaxID=3155478 RepID=UPI0033E11515